MINNSLSVPNAEADGRQRVAAVVAGLLAVLLCGLLGACMIGSVWLPISDILAGLRDTLTGAPENMSSALVKLRLLRALAAFSTGGALALAGVMMQVLLRNPLADPYVLGVSGGAAVGALAAMLVFTSLWIIELAAFSGAIAIALLLYSLAHYDLRGQAVERNATTLILTGAIVASGCGAMVTLILSVAPDSRLRGMVFWLIGDLAGVEFSWLPLLIVFVALVFFWRVARAINVLAMQADLSATLGVNAGVLRPALFACAALLTASALSTAGSIGFVGLIVPHACRYALGADHRLLLPAATLTGGIFLLIADVLARSLLAPQQLPVGAITAIIGVPIFLYQLHHARRR